MVSRIMDDFANNSKFVSSQSWRKAHLTDCTRFRNFVTTALLKIVSLLTTSLGVDGISTTSLVQASKGTSCSSVSTRAGGTFVTAHRMHPAAGEHF